VAYDIERLVSRRLAAQETLKHSRLGMALGGSASL
jgi:hypothetical protein